VSVYIIIIIIIKRAEHKKMNDALAFTEYNNIMYNSRAKRLLISPHHRHDIIIIIIIISRVPALLHYIRVGDIL